MKDPPQIGSSRKRTRKGPTPDNGQVIYITLSVRSSVEKKHLRRDSVLRNKQRLEIKDHRVIIICFDEHSYWSHKFNVSYKSFFLMYILFPFLYL